MKRIISAIVGIASLTISLMTYGQTPPRNISVGYNKTVMLVFPANIIDADRGSGQISVRIARKTPTVLKVKASAKDFDSTNLTIYTEDGRMYMTSVHYDPASTDTPYIFNAASDGCPIEPVFDNRSTTTATQIKELAANLASKIPRLKHPATKSAGIRLSLGNIWIKDDHLFFQLVITNASNIPYDIAFSKFYQRDNSKGRRTSIVEKELMPSYQATLNGDRVGSGGHDCMVVVFNKFTLSNQKHFAVEFFENGGDRHLALRIKGAKILHATPLP